MGFIQSDKKTLIKLQNIMFGSNERQLMVSQQFLDDCVKKYLIKHLRAINTCMSNIKITKNPALFYSSIPPLIEHLDALIKIETYYEMARPIPSAFKKEFEENRNLYASNMIKRYVHEFKQHTPVPHTIQNALVRKYYQDSFDLLMNFKSEMSEEETALVDVFYSGLFKRNYTDPIPANEYDSSNEDYEAETDEKAAAEEAKAKEAVIEAMSSFGGLGSLSGMDILK
jgi:hypothetical protein